METKTNEGPAMAEDQAQELAALTADAGSVAEVGEPEQQARPVLAEELKGLVLAFVAMASPMLPSLRRIYTEETTAAAAQAVAAVCDKHGWLQGGLMGDYGVEISAAVVLVPLAIATRAGIIEDLNAAKKGGESNVVSPDIGGESDAAPKQWGQVNANA